MGVFQNSKIITQNTSPKLKKTHQCLEKLKNHWKTNKSKTEHLNKNFEIQTLKFRGIQNRARWVYGGRKRKRGHLGRGRSWWIDWCQRRWEMSLSVVHHAWDYEMNWTTGVWYKGWVSEKVKEVILCWFREVGEMSEWGSWVMSNVIRRKRAKNERIGSVKLLLKPGRAKKVRVPTV